MITREELGKRLTAWRLQQKDNGKVWSVERLARELKVSRQTIANIETGKHSPSWRLLERIVKCVPDILIK